MISTNPEKSSERKQKEKVTPFSVMVQCIAAGDNVRSQAVRCGMECWAV